MTDTHPTASPAPGAQLEVDDDELLGQADWVIGGERARKARQQLLYAAYVMFVGALAYGFPLVQAVFRTTDRALLREQLTSPAAVGVIGAAVVVLLAATWWAGRFRGPVVPPLPWIDLVASAPIDRALSVRRWWRYAVIGTVFVGGLTGLVFGAGLAFAGVTGALAVPVALLVGLVLGLVTSRVWLWSQVRSWPGPDRGIGLLWRISDALRELHAESLRAHSANTSTIAGSALAGNLRTARLALARPIRHARGARLRPGRPFAVMVRRDLLGLRRQPSGFVAGLGLTLLGGAIVAWGAIEPAAPGIAVTIGLVPLYLGFGAWAEGLRLQADNVGTPSLLGTAALEEAGAHLVVPLVLTVLSLAACVAVLTPVASISLTGVVILVATVMLLVAGHLMAAFRGAPKAFGGPQMLVFWYLQPVLSVVLLGSLVAFFAKNGHETLLSASLWVALGLLWWGTRRVQTLTMLHRT
jgi:hypothetical protein